MKQEIFKTKTAFAAPLYLQFSSTPMPYPHKSRWALFVDIDGTISEIAPTPQEASIPLDLLIAMNEQRQSPIALISGREIASIDCLTAPYSFAAAGQHGLELRDALGNITLAEHINAAMLADILRDIERIASSHPGLMVERKSVSVAVHYRAVPEKEMLVKSYLSQLVTRYGKHFSLQHGKMVCEIRPSGSDKGTAIAFFMQFAPYAGKVPVYIGDDDTDEAGFETVHRLGGISIKIGEGATRAQYRLQSPQQLRPWLLEILPLLTSSERTKI